MAVVLKFIKLLKSRVRQEDPPSNLEVTSTDIELARVLWIKELQEEMKLNKKFKSWNRDLSLFTDENGTVRCKRQLSDSNLPCSAKYPILLDTAHYLTTLIVRDCHERVMHGGVRLLQIKLLLLLRLLPIKTTWVWLSAMTLSGPLTVPAVLLKPTVCLVFFAEIVLKRLILAAVGFSICHSSDLTCLMPSKIWAPQASSHDLAILEVVQRRATKFILQNDVLSYLECLRKLNLLPISYWLEIKDLIFFPQMQTRPIRPRYLLFCHLLF